MDLYFRFYCKSSGLIMRVPWWNANYRWLECEAPDVTSGARVRAATMLEF